MPHVLALAAILLTTFAFTADAQALSCQRRIVADGYTPEQVQQLCGDPLSKSTRLVARSQTFARHLAGGVVFDSVTVQTEVEVWVYDFGPRRFMHELTFEGGRLFNIRTLGYGRRVSVWAPTGDEMAALPRRRRRV